MMSAVCHQAHSGETQDRPNGPRPGRSIQATLMAAAAVAIF